MRKIIFIQGIHNFELRNRFILAALRAAGFEVSFFPIFYTVHQTRKQLELIGKIEAHLAASDDRFILLGHSFGGILAYSLREELYAKVDRIITVAAPHQVGFGWFRSVLARLPYRSDVSVQHQESYGFLFDTTVPFIFTRYAGAGRHRNLLGTHNRLLNSRTFVNRLLAS